MINYFIKNRIHAVLLLLLIVVFGFIVISFFRLGDRAVMTVDGFRIDRCDNITVGRTSDIAFRNVPKDFMSVTLSADGGEMSWKIDQDADTLMYYKINGDNPNLHKIIAGEPVKVTGFGEDIFVSLEEIDKCFDNHSDRNLKELLTGVEVPEYILLKHVICLRDNLDSLLKRQILEDEGFCSFVYRKGNGAPEICILDRNTSCAGERYTFEDKINNPEGKYQIQFFKVIENTYRKDNPSMTDVTVDDISHSVKPVILTTEWTAGHVTLMADASPNTRFVDVIFPKGISYVESLGQLKNRAEKTSGLITLSQEGNSYPLYNNIYLPAFSSSVNQNFGSMAMDGSDMMFIDNRNDTIAVKSRIHLVPVQNKMDLKSDSGNVYFRAAILNGRYWMSYMFFPLMVYIMLLVFIRIVFAQTGRIPNREFINEARVRDFHWYYMMMLSVLLAFMLCKFLIAIKLSFTYPYFEKISGIIVTSTSLILLLATTLTTILNKDYLLLKEREQSRYYTPNEKVKLFVSKNRAYIGFAILLFCFVLCVISIWLIDKGNMQAMISSYYKNGDNGISFFYDPLRWYRKVSVNDTHRSVIYTLFIVEGGLLLYLFLNLLWNKFAVKLGDFRQRRFKVNGGVKNYAYYGGCVLLLILANLLPGNFATAFITVIVILLFSSFIIEFNDLFSRKFILKAGLIIIAMFLAIIPDQGYMVSFIGILCAVLMFPLLTCNIVIFGDTNTRKIKSAQKTYWVIAALSVVLVIAARIAFPAVVDTSEVSYGRMERRLNLFLEYDSTKEAGYRYSESDMEFMQVMSHYMQRRDITDDPLCNDSHFLHPSISTGQSPVVLNDVSIQSSFFGSYGWPAHVIFMLLLLVLSGLVCTFNFQSYYYNVQDEDQHSFIVMRRRILALFIWLGASMYLYLSYLGYLPYTGRLIPGYGVDSVGEALEICFLIAFMSQVAVTCKEQNHN